jgi:fructose-bisphosphate aldolase, class I
MFLSPKVRMNRLFRNGKCLDVAIDHGVANEPSFLVGLEDMEGVMEQLVAAGPDAIQVAPGQADLLQSRYDRNRPALVMRTDLGNAYNPLRHREMWAVLQNADDPVLPAVQLDAAAVVVNLFMLPDEPELLRRCIENINRLRGGCERYGMPLMIEPLVMLPNSSSGGYAVDGDTQKIVTLVRLARELGADIIKADPTDDVSLYHKVIEIAGRIPVLVRGGGKASDKEILQRTEELVRQGAAGIVYGRNVIQHENPAGMTRALMALVHENASAEAAAKILENTPR